MKTTEILSKLEASIEPISELAGLFGVPIPGAISTVLSLANGLIARFSQADPDKDWTQDEINAEADAMIAGIRGRDTDFVKDDVDDSDDDDL